MCDLTKFEGSFSSATIPLYTATLFHSSKWFSQAVKDFFYFQFDKSHLNDFIKTQSKWTLCHGPESDDSVLLLIFVSVLFLLCFWRISTSQVLVPVLHLFCVSVPVVCSLFYFAIPCSAFSLYPHVSVPVQVPRPLSGHPSLYVPSVLCQLVSLSLCL